MPHTSTKIKAHPGNQYFSSPLTAAKGDIGDISILTNFHFNSDKLHQEDITRFPSIGGNRKICHWCRRSLTHRD